MTKKATIEILPEVRSLAELKDNALNHHDRETRKRYGNLTAITANALGLPEEEHGYLGNAFRWLYDNASETSEALVLKEINGCRDIEVASLRQHANGGAS